jgi:hypothetical protein
LEALYVMPEAVGLPIYNGESIIVIATSYCHDTGN